jgi:hypothetical protein
MTRKMLSGLVPVQALTPANDIQKALKSWEADLGAEMPFIGGDGEHGFG